MTVDFYSGFEGEPEFLFYAGGKLALRCWEGYLAPLLEGARPSEQGWLGLADAWHRDLWGDEPWVVPDLVECIVQLQAIDRVPSHYQFAAAEALRLRDALVQVFQEARERHVAVVVERS